MPYLPSIFDNVELLNQLVKIAQPPIKQAQTSVTPVDPNMVKSVATKMLKNLSTATSVNANTDTAPLYMRDLQSLDQLIEFLRLGQVKYAGHPIVNEQYSKMTPAEQSHYAPYKSSGGIDAMPMGATVGIYKDGLIAYLKTLQQHANETGDMQGRLAGTLIGKLIDSANATLKLGIKPEDVQIKDTGAAGKAQPWVNDNQPLDHINDTVIVETPLVPSADQGTIAIAPKNLKSKMDFDALARTLKISKGGKVLEYHDFTDSTFCDIIHVLYARAKSYAYRRGTYTDKAYLQLVTELASLYQCEIGGETGTNGVQPAAYHPEGGGKTLSGPAQKAAVSLAMKMPLLGDRIDFPRINNWLQAYASIGQQVGIDAATQAAIGHAQQILNTIATTYRVPSQSLAQDATSVASFVITNTLGSVAQKTGAPTAYLHQLQQLMSLVGTILSAFKNNAYDSLPQDAKDEIDEQIGSGGSSFYNINVDKVNTWLMDLPSAIQQLRTQGF